MLLSLWRHLRTAGQGNGLRAQLMRGGVGSVFLKGCYIGLGLAHSVVLARALGPAGYGVFAYVLAIVNILSVPSRFGLPTLLIRETAKGEVDKDWGNVHGLWRWSVLLSLGIAGALVTLSLTVLGIRYGTFTHLQITTFLWGVGLIPLIALISLAGAALRGLRRIVQGQLSESLVRPALFLGLVVLALFLAAGPLNAADAMALRVMVDVATLLVGVFLLFRRKTSRDVLQAVPKYQSRTWFLNSIPLAFTAGMLVINQQIGVVILGLFAPASTVGIYRVAMQGATLATVGLQAVNMVVAPQFARLYRQGEFKQLQHLVTWSTRGTVLLTLPVVVVFVLFGAPLLRIVFGNAYAAAYLPLAILALGQLAAASFGSVGYLLNMSGYEKETAIGIAIGAASSGVLNIALIVPFGLLGAAVATAFSLVLWKMVLWYLAMRYVRVNTLVLSRTT